MVPVSASTPERNEIGTGLTSNSPEPIPREMLRPAIIKITPNLCLKMEI
jgi:hypothetical protein